MSPNAIMTVIFLMNMVSLVGGVFVSEFYTGVSFMCDLGTVFFIVFSCRWFFERERELKNETQAKMLRGQQATNKKLAQVTKENELRKEALEFYANKDNWWGGNRTIKYNRISNFDLYVLFKRVEIGVKRARECEEKIKEGQ